MGSTIQTADTSLAVVGGRVVTPDAVIDGGVRIAGEQIAAVGDIDAGTDTVTDADTDTVTDANTDIVTDAGTDTVIDADGRLVLPGLVDIHRDDIEGHL